MENPVSMKVIAHIRSDFTTKFGIPRQSGIVEDLISTIVFEPEYRDANALRGLENFTYIWLIWQFSEAVREKWSPTVKPPRLGGNTRMGVFATRSPFRPNAIGLSAVKLVGIEQDSSYGSVLKVSGADLMDGTPIFDIKPYLPYADSHPDAASGFVDKTAWEPVEVVCDQKWLDIIPIEKRKALLGVLGQDPRPSYKKDSERVYGFEFSGFDVRFKVMDNILTVIEIVKNTSDKNN